MNQRVCKRIFNVDIKNYTKSKLDECGIHIIFDEVNLMNAHILIIGPKDTPYENGYYIFTVKFTEEYPFKPPKVLFQSISKVRIHPNMYTSGKVCLSILGTWPGPSWSSIMDINSIACSIQSLMSNKAIQHEPGFDSEEGANCKHYDRIIRFENINSYVCKIIERCKISSAFGFDSIILEHFDKNVILKQIDKYNLKKVGQIQLVKPYNISLEENYDALKIQVDEL